MSRVAILQSNYLPWKGYFDIIQGVDLFIFHDDLQYTKGDWRNRNRIKTPKGSEWITVPCGTSENRLICEVELSEPKWQRKHWSVISAHYQKAPFFKDYKAFFENFFLERVWTNLSDMNQYFIKSVSRDILKISTQFDDSRRYDLDSRKEDRVIDLLTRVSATTYVSGPSAKSYLTPSRFERLGIDLEWADYTKYIEYPQQHPPFEHAVSIIDLIFNVGPDALEYLSAVKRP